MANRLPLLIGILFAIIAIVLGLVHDQPSPLVIRLEIGSWAFAAGGIVTEVPGTLGVEWDLSKKIAAGTAGAIVAFVILNLLIRSQ